MGLPYETGEPIKKAARLPRLFPATFPGFPLSVNSGLYRSL